MSGQYFPGMPFREAGKVFVESKNFASGKTTLRYVSKRTLADYEDLLKPLNRFFGELALNKIHEGHLKIYQEQRAMGQLGPTYDELFIRIAGWHKLNPDAAKENPITRSFIENRMAAFKHEEVGASKVNQELSLLTRILRKAGVWSGELEESYEPLQKQESDIPKALTRQEQRLWLDTAASKPEWHLIYWYSVVAFATTASNVEMRNLRIGDLNMTSRTMYVRAATAKNKYRVRTIQLSPDAEMAMERLLERARGLGAYLPTHFLFPSRENIHHYNPEYPMSNTGLKVSWNEVRKASGLLEFTPHHTRHTAITRMAEAGVPMTVIMSMAGHVSPKMSLHYTAISAAAQRWAVEAVYKQEMYPVSNPAQYPKPVQNVAKVKKAKAVNFSS